MEKFVILKIMHQEHLDLEKMINTAVDGFQLSKSESLQIYEDFSKKIEKHFSFEEKAIYAISQNLTSELETLIRKLFAEHEEMRIMIKDIENCIVNDKHSNLDKFLSKIKQHHALEDMSLYPRLDEELSHEEKEKFREEFENNN